MKKVRSIHSFITTSALFLSFAFSRDIPNHHIFTLNTSEQHHMKRPPSLSPDNTDSAGERYFNIIIPLVPKGTPRP